MKSQIDVLLAGAVRFPVRQVYQTQPTGCLLHYQIDSVESLRVSEPIILNRNLHKSSEYDHTHARESTFCGAICQ